MSFDGDPYAGLMALAETLGRADKCRLVDLLVADLGDMAPVPQFEDDRSDAEWWRESQPHARRAIMWTVITEALTLVQAKKAREYLDGFIAEKEGSKAEPRGG